MGDVRLGVSIESCRECETMNCAIRVMRALQFRHSNGVEGTNFRSALEFDRETKEIVISEELLMQAIILGNPGQKRRKIRLVSDDEFSQYTKKRLPKEPAVTE